MQSAVKCIPALMAMAATALAAPGDPGESAVRFLEKIRSGQVNLEPGGDTALSEQTSGRKRQEISRRLDRLARDLGTDPLEVGAVKIDEDLAVVMVRKVGGFDPSRMQVFPVALVQRGAGWTAAPVPASFENSGVGYGPGQRKRLDALEEWMLREQVTDLENLRERSSERLRRKIEETLPADHVRAMTSQQAAERFLAACEQRKLIEILGLLGGLSAKAPANWSERLRSAEAAMHSPAEATRPWRLLTATEVLRIPVYHDDDPDGKHGILSIACLDAAGNPPQSDTPKVEIVHLPVNRLSDGIWRIDPPEELFSDADDPEDKIDPDASLIDMFPAKLATRHPVAPADTAAGIRDSLMAALTGDKSWAWVNLLRLDGDPVDKRSTCAKAAQLWWDIKNPKSARRVNLLDFHEEGDHAGAICQFFDVRNPDRADLRLLVFEKTPMGWLWNPTPSDAALRKLDAWKQPRVSRWQDDWQEALLSGCPKFEENPQASAPSESESRKLAEAWIQAAKSGDIAAALNLTARLNNPDSNTSLLRNLGYEFSGIRRNARLPVITSVMQAAGITAVATRAESDDKPVFPLYPIVSTPSGPRILLEIDLIASTNRGRAFLNRTSLDKLRKSSPDMADQLSGLFEKHLAATVEAAKP